MPIVFRGPDPVAPEIAAAYGAAQVSQQNLPQLAQQYAQQAQMAQQRNLQTAQLGLQAREGDLNRMTQGANIVRDDAARQQALQQQNQQAFARINAEQDQTYFQAEAAAARQRQGAELQAWLNQQDLSQKEKMRLERMRNAIGEVESLVSSKQLTEEEAANYMIELKTGIDPIQHRLQAEHARKWKEQADQAAKVAKVQADIGKMTAEEQVKYLKSSIIPLGEGFFAERQLDGTFKSVYHPPPKEEKPAASKPGPFQYDRPFQYSDYQKEAEAEADVRFPVLPNAAGTVKDINAVARAEFRQQLIEGYKAAHVARQHGQQGPGGGQQQGAAQPEEKPFAIGSPPEQMTPTQRVKVQQLSALADIARAAAIPAEQQAHSVSAAQQATAALAKHGSVENMRVQDPQLFQQFQGWMQYLDQLPPAPTEEKKTVEKDVGKMSFWDKLIDPSYPFRDLGKR